MQGRHHGHPTCHAARQQDRPLDLWLRRTLCASHDDILGEQLPDEWLAMIRRAERQG